MKYLIFLCLTVSACSPAEREYTLTIHSFYSSASQKDTTHRTEKIVAINDSIAYSEAYARFLTVQSVAAAMNYSLGVPFSFTLTNKQHADIRLSLPSHVVQSIEQRENSFQDTMAIRIEQARNDKLHPARSVEPFLQTVRENKNILRAEITDGGYLAMAVLNDGMSKDAMATYYCRLAKSSGMALIKVVKILDATSATFEKGAAYGKELGRAYCK